MGPIIISNNFSYISIKVVWVDCSIKAPKIIYLHYLLKRPLNLPVHEARLQKKHIQRLLVHHLS